MGTTSFVTPVAHPQRRPAYYNKYGKLIAKSGTGEFSLPLACSGVLGSGCSKYLPMHCKGERPAT